MAVTSAIKSNPTCTALHLRLRQKGKPQKVVRLDVVNKLIRQCYAIVKSGKTFDPNFEEKSQAAHHQNDQNNKKTPEMK